MKIAPFVKAIDAHNRRIGSTIPDGRPHHTGTIGSESSTQAIDHILVHTGQHYDERMSQSFFDALDIPRPDIDLEVGSGSHAEQVGKTMIAFERVLRECKPDWVVVVGDVNATCACSITAKKEHLQVAHIEAGLRSFDLDMPEEINRMVTDRLSDMLLTPDELSSENLRKEGVPEEKIKFVGNIMIDTLEAHREAAAALDIETILRTNAVAGHRLTASDSYALMTMHRPSNVDKAEVLEPIIDFLLHEVCADMPLVWPLHPRARKQLDYFGLWDRVRTCRNTIMLHPIGYHEMLRLNMGARLMLTDSGGLQEECCVLGTPCITMRRNTERPITLRAHSGTCALAGNAIDRLRHEYTQAKGCARSPIRPRLWDGHTAERIVSAFLHLANT